MPALRAVAALLFLLATPLAASAQEEPRPSMCLAVAGSLPEAIFVSFTGADLATGIQAEAPAEEVTITYAGHSTYVIETPAGVRIATDFSGYYGADPLPDVVTMNKAHSTHFTYMPDPGIEHVLTGWNPEGGPIRHAVVVGDVYIRNVQTDIRRYGMAEKDGNSIFIFEVAGLCIGHLGHLHHELGRDHYAAIGRLDVVMVPVDGGLTMGQQPMSNVVRELRASIVLPMHRNGASIDAFIDLFGEDFAHEFRDEPGMTVSLGSLPRLPTIVVLQGV